ncbi:BppU family phage baseplate upper protein [Lactococcus cremoris]
MSDYSVTLSTTEPNNYVGLIKLRQGDVNSQSIQATITANGQLFNFDHLAVFFNAVLPNGNVVRDKVTKVDYANSKLNYIVADSFLQEVTQVTAWFSFENGKKIIDSTKNFQYSVIGGWKECIPQGNYIYELSEIQREIEEIISNKDFTSLISKISSIEQKYNVLENETTTQLADIELIADNAESVATIAAQKADAMAGGSPKGVYSTLALLQAAYPTGTTGVYLVTADGKWYFWNGSAWTIGGTYQSTGIAYGSVTKSRLENTSKKILTALEKSAITGQFNQLFPTSIKGSVINRNTLLPSVQDPTSYYTTVQVQEGERFKISTHGRNNPAAGSVPVVYANASGGKVSEEFLGIAGTAVIPVVDYEITIPAFVTTMYVSNEYGNYAPIIKKYEYDIKFELKTMPDEVDHAISVTNNLSVVNEYVELGLTQQEGYIQRKTLVPTVYNLSKYIEVDVQEGQLYKITTRGRNNPAAGDVPVIYVNASNIKLSEEFLGITSTSIVTVYDYEVTIPVNTTKMYVSSVYDGTPLVVKQNQNNVKLNVNSLDTDVLQKFDDITDSIALPSNSIVTQQNLNDEVSKRNLTIEKQNDFAWKPFDKGYFVFVYDDGNTDLPTIKSIFDGYGIPLSCAIISNTLDRVMGDGSTLLQTCLAIQNSGGEIFSHSINGDVFTESTTRLDAENRLATSKIVLQNAGLMINGFVKPGGPGSLGFLTMFEDIIRKYYRYGYSCSENANQYKEWRWGMGTSIATLKAQIDSAVKNKTLLTLYSHSLTEVPEATVRELIEYIQAKGSGAAITTFGNLYNTFGTTELERRIAALEVI